MVLNGVNYAEKKDAGAALIETCRAQTSPELKEIGLFRGFALLLSYDTFSKVFKLTLKGTLSHTIDLGSDIHGNIRVWKTPLICSRRGSTPANRRLPISKRR